MAWNNQGGGGPWGGGGGNDGGSPWGGGGRGPGGGNQPPDIEEILRRGQEGMKKMMPGGGLGSGKGIALALVAVLVAWSLTGIYRVNANEEAVELLFGKYIQRQGPGLHIWFPTPIGEILTPNVTEVRTISVGSNDSRERQAAAEGMMLTGDQNIIDMNFIVQWNLKDVGDYVFNIAEVEGTLRAAAESAMREVVGQANLDYVMTDGRAEIATKTRTLLQRIMDDYGSGVNILDVKLQKADPPAEVIDAFNDVQRARQDQERLQNEANAYRNDIVPRAKGQAARLTEDAAAYKERVIKDAEGEAARFSSVYDSYAGAKDVTSQRLYLEALQDVLSKSDKVIIDQGTDGQGVVPYLPLPEIQKRANPSSAPRQGGN